MSRNHLGEASPSHTIKPTGIVQVPRLNISKLKKYVDTNKVEDYTTKHSGKISKPSIKKPAEAPTMRKKYQRHEIFPKNSYVKVVKKDS